MRSVLAILATGAVLAGIVGTGARFPLHRSRPHRTPFQLALDGVAQTISRRDEVSVRCGSTGDPAILGSVAFYGEQPGREALLAPRICGTLERLRHGAPPPSLDCTRLGGGPCGRQVVDLAWAASALAHESVHLGGVRDEAAAECYGLQWTALAAERLGATPAYARALADYTFWNVRPPVDAGYFSPECRNGGRLDLHPRAESWP